MCVCTTVQCTGGALLGDVDAETAVYDLALPLGHVRILVDSSDLWYCTVYHMPTQLCDWQDSGLL